MARKRATDLSKTDMTMLVLIVLLVIFGLAVLFSSSEYNGRVRFGDSACYFKKQLFATALGMGVMYMVSSIDYHFFLRLGPVAYLISMFLSGAVLFVGQEINGSKRWLNLGPLSFQPSEFAKVAVILLPPRRGGLLLYGAGPRDPASHHEAADHGEGAPDRHEAPPGGQQEGEDHLPHHDHRVRGAARSLCRASDRVPDARQPVQGVRRCGASAEDRR